MLSCEVRQVPQDNRRAQTFLDQIKAGVLGKSRLLNLTLSSIKLSGPKKRATSLACRQIGLGVSS